jgi:hypothetical protein
MTKYTVIMLYPDHMNDDGGETYTAQVDASTPEEALIAAQDEAVSANSDEASPDDFRSIAIMSVVDGEIVFHDDCDADTIEQLRAAQTAAAQPPTPSDFDLTNQGSLMILVPVSEAAQEWANEHLPDDAMKWGGGFVIEHRFIDNIVDGIEAEGLIVG